jgi:hypothetical protein
MNPPRNNRRACAYALALSLPSVAPAAVIMSDNFDSYATQAAFEAVWIPIGTAAPTSAILSTEQFVSAGNSIKLESSPTITGQYRNRRSFSETALAIGSPIEFSIDFYDSSPTTSPQRNYVNLQDTTAPTGTNQLISLGLNNNQTAANSGGNYYMARILGYTVPTTADPDGGATESVGGAGAYFKLNDFGVGLRSLGWHNLKVIISTDDGLSADYEFYVDGLLAERVSNIGTSASIRSYDNITLGSGFTNGGVAAYVDNVRLETVPEPAAFATILGGLGCLALRRRRGGAWR